MILSAEEYAKVRPTRLASAKGRTGADLIAIMQKGRKLGLKPKPARIWRMR